MIKKILRRIRHVVEIQKYKKSASKNKNIPLAKGIAENGVLFIAFGRSYVSEAVFCAQSIRNCSDIGIAIFCDSIKSHERSLFDFVSLIEPNHSRAKVDYLKYTPFKNTLYLDSDTQVVEDITDIFSLLERFDLAMAHDFARKRQRWCEIIPEYKRIPDGFSEFGGGVILYTMPACEKFIQLWSEYFYKYFRKTNGWDQASLRIAVWQSSCAIYVLPQEFNVRGQHIRDKTDTLPEKEGGLHPLRPRILHWHGLDDPSSDVKQYRY